MNHYREIQKITLRNLILRLSIRGLGDKVKYKVDEHDNLTEEELDDLIKYYQDMIIVFDASEKYPLF